MIERLMIAICIIFMLLAAVQITKMHKEMDPYEECVSLSAVLYKARLDGKYCLMRGDSYYCIFFYGTGKETY